MKYTKIVSSLMISTMALNLIQQGVTIYAEEQTPATTVTSEEAKKELKGDSILDSLGETGISSEKEVPNTEEPNEQPTLSTEASSEPSMKETTPSISKEEAKDSSDKTEKIQVKADASDVTEGDWTAHWDDQLGRYKLTNYTGDKTNVQVPTTFQNKPVAISLVEMSNTLNLKGLTSFSATGTNKEIKVLDTDLKGLFNSATATTIDMRGFDVSNVTNIRSMFIKCSNLTTLDIGNWDTSNITNMMYVFNGCSKLVNIDFSNWNTSNVTNMDELFYNCSSLAHLNLSNWNLSKVTSGLNMFYGVKNCVIDGDKNEFTRFSDISLDASNIWLEDVENAVNTLFKDDTHTILNDGITQDKINDAKKEVDKLPDSLDTKKELSDLIAQAQKLFDTTEGDWTGEWDEQLGRYKLTNYTGDQTNVQVPTTFKNKPVAISLVEMSNTLNLKGLTSFSATGTNKEIKVLDTDWSNLFWKSTATTIDMRGFDTANVTNMAWMFRHCSNLTNVDVSNLDTSNVTNMNCMFEEVKFSNADFSKWDVSKVTDMGGLFYNCSSLTKLDVSNWNLSQVTLGTNMFYGVKNCVIDGDKNEFTRLSNIGLDASNIWLEDVENVVNTLFKDDTHTVLNDGITQDKINDAKKEVDKLPDSLTEKKELSELVAKAQKLFNEKEQLETEGDWTAHWDEQLGRYKLTNYTGDKTNVQVPTTFNNKPVAISLVEMSNALNLKGLTSFSATGTDKEIKVLDTDWSNLFDTSKVTTIDMRGFDVSNVTNMYCMFSRCSSLTSLDVSNWDTSKVTTMAGLFQACSSLTSVDLSNWDTKNVSDMRAMFTVSSLTSVDLSNWDVSNVTTMRNMFYDCGKLTNLNLSGWSPSSLTNTDQMFYSCRNLKSLDLSGWDTSSLTNAHCMFQGCSSLTELDLSGWNTSKLDSLRYTFTGCTNLSVLKLNGWDVSNVTDMTGLFGGCENVTELDLEGWDISNVRSVAGIFKGCDKLTNLNLKNWKLPVSLAGMFQEFNGLKHVDMTGWDLSKTTNLSNMFKNCDIDTLDLSSWDVSSVTNLSNMFNGCRNLTTLNLSGWDASYVTNMDSMFANCSNLTNLDVSNWKLPSSLAGMFKNYTGTTAPDLSTWDVSHVTNMSHMFNGCTNMTEVNVKDWDVSHVTNMESMFQNCTNLTTLDVSKWDTSRVTNMRRLFIRC
ncbi:BspA family leucine-rich repeat surface protein, partial [Enterococcus faecium]|nr:BspA family leucine-rich repeat surface protein [Enterococcus faecium]